MTDHDSVRRSYDAVAGDYAAEFRDELAAKPLDRALLTCLIEQAEPGTPIADLGCGPGHVAAWLAERGATAIGIDLSAAMISVARREHPEVEFREGDLLALPAADGEFGAAVAFYSLIHMAPGELGPALAEARRTLAPGGRLLASFHAGSEVRHLDEWWGHQVNMDFRFLETPDVAEELEKAGFTVEMRMDRTPYAGEVDTRRAYVLARRT